MIYNGYIFFIVYGFIILIIFYMVREQFLNKDKNMYYKNNESNTYKIKGVKNNNKNAILQHDKRDASITNKEGEETREEDSYFI